MDRLSFSRAEAQPRASALAGATRWLNACEMRMPLLEDTLLWEVIYPLLQIATFSVVFLGKPGFP